MLRPSLASHCSKNVASFGFSIGLIQFCCSGESKVENLMRQISSQGFSKVQANGYIADVH